MTDLVDDDGFWAVMEPFDTGTESQLRDANPVLWQLLRCSEAVASIPLSEALRNPPLARETWMYVRRVSLCMGLMFNPDGTLKEKA